MKILFLHGWHSVPGGVKPTYLKHQGHEVINPALDDDDFDAAVKTAQEAFDKHQPLIVVGSSRGGAVAMNINSGKARLVLLCPAWKNWGMAKTVRSDAVILHSRADDVIPFAHSEELSQTSGASLIETGNDHRLADPEPLAAMLRACVQIDESKSCIELHDSTISGIVFMAHSLVVRFRPGYIHRSAGRPGFDPGSGWVQDIDLIFENARLESGFTQFPFDLWDGSVSVDDVIFNNEIPFPIDARGEIRVSFKNRKGEIMVINANRMSVRTVGRARYVEEFHGSD